MACTSPSAPQSQIQVTYAFLGLAHPSACAYTSATSSSPLGKLPCFVFINHRGHDVKHTLARAIYNPLEAMGFRVFLNSEELQLGDFFLTDLQEAIARASLHVACLSPTYAQSPWCLAELSFILKSGTPIIPFSYRVQPDDVRHLLHGKGIYAADFLKHQKKSRYSTYKLKEWKMALHKVPFYKEESINNNDEEQRVLKNIVNPVLKVMKRVPVLKVMKRVPVEVAKHAVDVEEAVADFEMTACESVKTYPNVQIVGICTTELGWSGLYDWERLVNKCLVDLGYNNHIIGREIASTQSHYHLWSPDQITGIQKQEKDRIQIRGMIFNAETEDVHKFPGFLLNTSIRLCGFRRTRRHFPVGLKVFVVRENYGNNLYIAKLSRVGMA